MFDDKFFDQWLDQQSQRVMQKIADGHGIQHEEMMILMLKAQTNHFAHLDRDLRNEMIDLRKDMDKRFEQVDKRFEQVDKRFEQVDKRFEQVQEELKKLYQAINTQTWKMIGAIGLIVVLARLADSLRLGAS
jgi:septal ring factor EnvC (AmiA/AmiB activator)